MTRSTFTTPGSRFGSAPSTALDPYRRAIRRHPWLVLFITLATVAAGVAWATTRSNEYTTSAQILVTPASDDPATAGLPVLTESVDPTRTLATAATMLTSPRAAELAALKLGDGATADSVRDAVAVEPQGNSNIVAITATAGDPGDAARAANAYADGALTARRSNLRRLVDAKLSGVQAREAALSDPNSAAAAALAAQASTLQSIKDGQDPNFSMLQVASAPSASTGTATLLIVVLTLIVGLALGTGAAMAVEQLDRRVRDEDELSELTTLPVLARVPVDRHHDDSAPPPSGAIEAFRALQIQLEARGRGSRAIVVTSASEGDGKTTSAIALARTLASSGRRVILLDFDLRKSEAGERLGVRSDLLRMLRTDGTLTDVLVAVPHVRHLRVLSAPPVGDAGALFQAYSRRLPELVQQARKHADFVIIDTPPLGRVADALRLVPHADDLLLVARPGNTDRRELMLAQETLQQLGIIPSGLILVGGSRRTPGYYGFTGVDAYPAMASIDSAAGPSRNGELPEALPSDVARAAGSAVR